MAARWRVAKSLDVLLAQINEGAPGRDKDSDGSIGDAEHATRASDHNPWIRDGRMGVVTARDFTHDPDNGLDCHELAKALLESRDARIKYIIWNKQICSSIVSPWQWRPYKGSNPHTKHLHLSVRKEKVLYDDDRLWAVRLSAGAAPVVQPLPQRQPKPQPVAEAVRSSRTIFGVLTALGASLMGWLEDSAAQIELLEPVKQIGSGLGLNMATVVFGITIAGLALALYARLDDAAKGRVVK